MTEAEQCSLMVQTEVDFVVVEVMPDPDYIAKRKEIIDDFFWYLVLELADSREYRDLPLRTYEECRLLVESPQWRTWPERNPILERELWEDMNRHYPTQRF